MSCYGVRFLCQSKRGWLGRDAGEILVHMRQSQERLGEAFDFIATQRFVRLLFHDVIVELIFTNAMRRPCQPPLRIDPGCREH